MIKLTLLPLFLITLNAQATWSLPRSASSHLSFLETSPEATQSQQSRCGENPKGAIELPKEEKTHPMLEEWWYWIVHLFTDDGTYYSAQWAFVKDHPQETPRMQSNFVLFTPESMKYITQIISKEIEEVDGEFSLDYGDAQAYGKDGKHEVFGRVEDATLRLYTNPVKAPFLYYEDGHKEYHFGGYLNYYCRPRNELNGILTLGDQTLNVTGYGYFEHAFGIIGPVLRDGWDWFNLQLDDGTEILIALVRMNYYLWTYDQDCTKTRHDFKMEIVDTWLSPKTECKYAVAWKLSFDGKEYDIKAVFEDNEVIERPTIKLDAPLVVTGSGNGRGYYEMIGTC